VLTVDFNALLEQIQGFVNATGIAASITRLGWGLLTILFLLTIARAMTRGDGREITEGVIRLLIAGTLLLSLEAITEVSAQAFASFSQAGFEVLGRITSAEAFEQAILRILATIGGINLTVLLGQAAAGAVEDVWILSAISKGADVLSEMIRTGMLLVGLLLALLYAVYYVITFTAKIILMLSSLLAPLSFAAVAHQRTEAFAWRWLRAVLHACLIIFLANLILSAALYLGIVVPSENISFSFNLADPSHWREQLGETFQALWQLVIMPVGALGALLFGVLCLLRVETFSAQFIEAAGAGAMAAFAALPVNVVAARAVGRQVEHVLSGSASRGSEPGHASEAAAHVTDASGPPPGGSRWY
jgi:hypothetical protein